MSETNVPYGTGAGAQRPWAPGHEPSGHETHDSGAGGSGGSGTSGVKDRVADVASHAGDAGRETAHDAKERARDVAHEASDRTRGLADRTRTELMTQVGTQQRHLAGGLRALGDELGEMSDGNQQSGYASELVQRAGQATGQVAQWFDEREPTDVLHEVEEFARRRPGTFVLLAAGAGLLVGRLLRGAKDAPGSDDGHGSGHDGGGSAARGGSGDYPAASQVPAGSGETPPAFPPTAPDGARPQMMAGGEHHVERP